MLVSSLICHSVSIVCTLPSPWKWFLTTSLYSGYFVCLWFVCFFCPVFVIYFFCLYLGGGGGVAKLERIFSFRIFHWKCHSALKFPPQKIILSRHKFITLSKLRQIDANEQKKIQIPSPGFFSALHISEHPGIKKAAELKRGPFSLEGKSTRKKYL